MTPIMIEQSVAASTDNRGRGIHHTLLSCINRDTRYSLLSFSSADKPRHIDVFSLRGQKIMSLSIPCLSEYVLLDKETLSSGTFIARFRNESSIPGAIVRIP
jgi:hypothetical protein